MSTTTYMPFKELNASVLPETLCANVAHGCLSLQVLTPEVGKHLRSLPEGGASDPPVDDALLVQVTEAAADLRGVELHLLLPQARGADVVDVEAEVPSVHDGQHHAQSVLGLVGVGQAHLRRGRENKDAVTTTPALVHIERRG